MPRTARNISASNIYHVMLRGINRQDIFEDDEDRFHFMNVLARCKKESSFRLHAFVLMSNHIHLLIEPAGEPLDIIFKRIGTSYAVWYNRKYQRAGHLFQDRFRSENVETDQYYMTVLRYILQNPLKAGLERSPGNYRWSSYLAYKNGKGMLTDTQFAEDLFGTREKLIDYLTETNDDSVMDEEDHDWRLRDDAAREIMKRITGCTSASDFQNLDLSLRKEYVKKLYSERLSMAQIARLAGISKATVYRMIRSEEARACDDAEEGLLLRESKESAYYFNAETIW